VSAVSRPIPLEISVDGHLIFRLREDGSIETDWKRIEEHARHLAAGAEQSVILCAAFVAVAQQTLDRN
jgi:hypothetical protein